jgi:predicted double-glycine peptidase
MVATITIITQDKNKILPNEIPRRIIGERTQFSEHFKFNKRKGEAQHNKNYGNKIIIAIPKKWIRDHKQPKSDMTTHYDTIIKPIFRT